jgi:hypothetical protein
LMYFKNFCKCHNVPPPSTILKKEKKSTFYWFPAFLIMRSHSYPSRSVDRFPELYQKFPFLGSPLLEIMSVTCN